MVKDDQPDAREGQAGRLGVAERFAVPGSRVMPGEGRGLSSRQTQDVGKNRKLGNLATPECVQKLQKRWVGKRPQRW